MNLDSELLTEYANSVAEEVAMRFSKKTNLEELEYKALITLIKTEIEFAFSGLVEKKPITNTK